MKKIDFIPMKTNTKALAWCHDSNVMVKFRRKKVYIIVGDTVLSEGKTLLKAVNTLIEFKVKEGKECVKRIIKERLNP